jgi:hypothetical protein
MKLRYITLCIIACFTLVPSAVMATGQSWGKQANGLEMTIRLNQTQEPQSKTPNFRVELHNCGENDYVLNLGIMLANGNKQYPGAVVLNITDSRGKARRFELIEPTFVAGRLDPLIVPLAIDASFSIPVNLHKYWAAASSEFDYKFEPGLYYVEAQFAGTAPVTPIRIWRESGSCPTGKAQSFQTACNLRC